MELFLNDLSFCGGEGLISDWQKIVSFAEFIERLNEVSIIAPKSNNDRRALLIKHGTTIAEVNGWKYNREISELNSAQNHPRYIFDSGSRFTAYRPAYLSIDQEGPEVCFELCASNGSHLGEISWDGKWKEAKDNHGIKVS